jgi:hypothetical protein
VDRALEGGEAEDGVLDGSEVVGRKLFLSVME